MWRRPRLPAGAGRRRGFRALAGLTVAAAIPVALLSPLPAIAGTAYDNAVVSDSPLYFYELGESSGTTAVDSSGNGNTGNYQGSETLGVPGPAGVGGTAVSFSGGDVDSNYAPASLNTFSLEAWVNIPAAIPAGQNPTIIGYSPVANTHQGFTWYLNSDNTSNVMLETSGTGQVTSPAFPAIALNTWHYMAVTYDGSQLCGYLDGSQSWCTAVTGTVVMDNGNHVDVATTPGGPPGGSGNIEIADAAFYTHALTSSRILAHYDSRLPAVTGVSPPSGTVGGGTPVTISGNGFSGATAVSFGSTPAASFSVTDDTTISATSPAGAGPGIVDVTVTGPAGQSPTSSADHFTYTQYATATATPGSSANPSTYTQSVTFSTTVTGGSTPTGTVTWKDGATTLGSSTLDGAGATTFSTAGLGTGAHSITAVYGGDGSHAGSTSSSLNQVVQVATPTVSTPVSTVNPSTYGQSTTFSVTVGGPGATPTGTVTWNDGATALGTTALGAGATSLAVATLGAGAHSITAAYSGDGNYATATSAALTQSVNAAATSTALGSAPNPSTAGQSVAYTATVTATAPGAGTPTGTVTFYDGATSIGTASLSGGTATLSVVETGGSHVISAQYAGDPNFNGSTSGNITQTVNPATSTVSSLSSSANPSTYGAPITLTVTVTGPSFPPTGTVTFYDGATPIGTATLGVTGSATLSISTLSAGSHSLTAHYSGDVNNTSATTGALVQVVNQAAASLSTPTASANPSTFGAGVTFSVTVSGAGATPTGTITWTDGAVTLGTSSVGAGGTATFAIATLTAGAHSITAAYGGDVNYTAATSAALSQTVNRAAVTVSTPLPSVNPVTVAQAVTFTVGVSGAGVTGTVTWMDGGTALGSSPLNASGSATFTASTLGVGSHAITAAYGGDTNYNSATSSALSETVQPATATIATPVASLNPSTVGDSVTFTTYVSGVSPTGTVTWLDGGGSLGATVLGSAGDATLTTATLGVGNHAITAAYGGDADNTAATSSALAQQVARIATAVSMPTSSANPSVVGASVQFSVTVSPAGATGSVTWMDGGTSLSTTAVDAGGAAAFATAALGVGTHSITAAYAGDTTHAPAASPALTQTVSRMAPAITTPVSSANPSTIGQAVTFSVSVSGYKPTGTVTWHDGAAALGTTGVDSGGASNISSAGLALGAHAITASYSGDTNNAPAASAALVQTVVKRTAAVSTPVSSLDPSLVGVAVTFAVSVSPGDANGSVTWMDGNTVLATTALDGSAGSSYTTSGLAAGLHAISAVYSGDAVYSSAASATLAQLVTLPVPQPPTSGGPSTGSTPTPVSTPTNGSPAPAGAAIPAAGPSASPAPSPSAGPVASGSGPPPAGGPPHTAAGPNGGVQAVQATAPLWLRIAGDLATKSAFPLLLLILAILFLVLQDRIDRKDPKLALAPARPDPKLTFPIPRGNP